MCPQPSNLPQVDEGVQTRQWLAQGSPPLVFCLPGFLVRITSRARPALVPAGFTSWLLPASLCHWKITLRLSLRLRSPPLSPATRMHKTRFRFVDINLCYCTLITNASFPARLSFVVDNSVVKVLVAAARVANGHPQLFKSIGIKPPVWGGLVSPRAALWRRLGQVRPFRFSFGSSSDPELYLQCCPVERAAPPNGLDNNGVHVASPPLVMFARCPTSRPGGVDEEEEHRLCVHVRTSPEPPASTARG